MPASSDEPPRPAVPAYPSGGASSGIQDAVRRDIITGRLQPGERVTEASLALRYAVSRVPVREALRGLESEGFVESRPHAGSRVAGIPDAEAEDLFALREALEVATVRRAARRAAGLWSEGGDPADWGRTRSEIARLLDHGDAHVETADPEVIVDVNDRLHLAVAQLSGSSTLALLLRQLSWKIEWLYALNPRARGTRLWPDHRRIVAAVDAGDEEAAAALMTAHVRASRDGYLARYRS